MSALSARRLARSIFAVTLVVGVGEIIFSVLNRHTDVEGSFGPLFDTVFRVGIVTMAVVGMLVARRHPANPIGWIFQGGSLLFTVSSFALGYGTYALFTDPGSLPAASWAAWLASWMFLPGLVATPVFVFLLFPDGRFAGRGWPAVGWLAGAAMLAVVASAALAPGGLGEPPFNEVANPLGIEVADAAFDVAFGFGLIAALVCIVAGTISMILRLRRARGIERQQLKWVTSAAVLFAVSLVVPAVGRLYGEPSQIVILVGYTAIPIAAGVAILRHHLYDIDLVIRRTLVYTSLTVLLAGTYVGSMLLLQLALNPVTEGSSVAVALSTLVVAALFGPVRRRVQGLVDRRFSRRRYDAERTLDAFGGRLRDQVDLDAIGSELSSVVRTTMEPAHVSLWLRPIHPTVTLPVTISGRSPGTKDTS